MGSAIEFESDTIVHRAKEVAFSQLDDELLAIDAQSGYCYSLNETAGKVWELIAEPTSIHAICAQLRQSYAVEEAICQCEVLILLKRLCDAGLARVVEKTSG